MSVSGNLKTMLPGDLLQWLSLGQKSGTLVVKNKLTEKKIFFRNGRVISSASNDPREYLGQFLMSHGYLTEPELKKAMEVQKQSGILLGKILVMIEVISEKDLTRLMRLKAEEEIYDIFLWREGEFHFIDDQLPTMEMIPLQVDVTGIIMEGTRRFDEWVRIRELIPNEALVPMLEKPLTDELAEELELDDAAKTVIAAIDGKRTIADIILESRSSSFRVSETLAALAREDVIRLTDPMAQRVAAAEAELAAAAATEDDEIAGMLQRAQIALRAKDFEKAQRLLKAAQNLDPNHPKVSSAIKGAETVILAEVRNQGLLDNKVPYVAKPFEEITQMNFTPNEGFILSRINGQWDIGSLIKISPIREPDAMLIFYKLWRDGIIALN
jgi:tetratricopeptide (TPR) repeat protein